MPPSQRLPLPPFGKELIVRLQSASPPWPIMICLGGDAWQRARQSEAPALRFLAKCAALEAAIVEVCHRLKVDVWAIKKMAGCPDDDVQPEALQTGDDELVKQYANLFAALIS